MSPVIKRKIVVLDSSMLKGFYCGEVGRDLLGFYRCLPFSLSGSARGLFSSLESSTGPYFEKRFTAPPPMSSETKLGEPPPLYSVEKPCRQEGRLEVYTFVI